MEIPLVSEIVIIFGLSIAVIYVCHQLGLPAIVGFLLTGLVAGPLQVGLTTLVAFVIARQAGQVFCVSGAPDKIAQAADLFAA